MKQSLKTKLMILAGLAAAMSLIIAVYAAWHLERLGGVLNASLDDAHNAIEEVIAVDAANVAFKTQVQEWKNILVRGNDQAQFDKYLKAFGDEQQVVRTQLGKAAAGARQVGLDPALVEAAIAQIGPLDSKYREALKGFDVADPEAGKKVDVAVKGMDRPLSEAMRTLSASVTKLTAARADLRMEQGATTVRQALTWLLGGALLLAAAVLAGALALTRSILRPVQRLQLSIRAVEQNWDLGLRAGLRGSDEIAQCGQALDSMLERFQTIVREMRTESARLVEEAGSVARTMEQLGQASIEQTDSTSAVSAAVEQLTVSMDTMQDAARESSSLSQHSQGLARSSREASASVARQMEGVATRVTATAATMEELSRRSTDISGIVATVKEIADQTNLLALNAAIEAARAGEQGRGFAVVADEVRKLAENTTRATDKIARLIQVIEQSSSAAVADISAVVDDVQQQVTRSSSTTESINALGESADTAMHAATRITDSLGEQGAATHLIAQQVERIAQISEQNTASVNAMVLSAQALRELADRLAQSAARFTV